MSGAGTIALYALRESTRRRVFVVVLVLTLGFLALYAVGTEAAFDAIGEIGGEAPVDDEVLTGSTLLGLAMFTTLFLGCVLAVFLTLGAVRGDAERGLLQPLVVRPLGRSALLAGRFAAAAGVCGAYVAAVYTAALLITAAAGGWWPDHPVMPGLGLVAGVVIIAALSLLGSVLLSATANGIAVFMIFGAGLAAGLLGQIGDALSVDSLQTVAEVTSWLLPFEALYQGGLDALTSDVSGATGVIVQLGPFGGAQEGGPLLWLWSAAYVVLVGAAAPGGLRAPGPLSGIGYARRAPYPRLSGCAGRHREPSRGTERPSARCRAARRGTVADPRRRRLRKDARAHPPDRSPRGQRPGAAERDPGHHVHQQGGSGDARARTGPGRRPRAGDVGDDLPLGVCAHAAL